MIAFIKGMVSSYTSDAIILENNGIGYRIFVSNPQSIKANSEVMMYTYQHVREDAIMLFGFVTVEEHDLFMRLISVKGVGPKTALNMLAVCPAKDMIMAIESNDVKRLKTLPGIGAKSAQQIVLDLKGKLVEEEMELKVEENTNITDALEALKALGYKSGELQGVSKEMALQEGKSVDQYIRLALGILAKRKGI